MRTIKFRGKCIEDGKWIYGYLADEDYINDINEVAMPSEEVAPDTVGQFTGMHDKNGTEIYEGDILSDGEAKYEVWYSEDRAGFIAEMCVPQNYLVDYLGGYDTERMMTVIGNIHDSKIKEQYD